MNIPSFIAIDPFLCIYSAVWSSFISFSTLLIIYYVHWSRIEFNGLYFEFYIASFFLVRDFCFEKQSRKINSSEWNEQDEKHEGRPMFMNLLEFVKIMTIYCYTTFLSFETNIFEYLWKYTLYLYLFEYSE